MMSALYDAVRSTWVDVQVVVVDNNPLTSPKDPEIYRNSARATIVRSDAATIGGVRNTGVKMVLGEVDYLVFLDSDVVVRQDFFDCLVESFASPSIPTVVGCKVVAPPGGHWTELAADLIHRQPGDGPRLHMNSGCMAIRAEAFRSVGGFSNSLPANEDYDLCDRVRAIGGTIWQFESLQAIHLGNPKSVGGVFRRLRWHGRGAFSPEGKLMLSPMVLLVLLNTVSVLGTLGAAAAALLKGRIVGALVALLVGVVIAPFCFWFLRSLQFRRWINPTATIPLIAITLLARQVGMLDQIRIRQHQV